MKQTATGQPNHLWRLFYPILTYMGIYTFIELMAGTLALAAAVVSIKEGGGSLEYYGLLEQTMIITERYTYEINAVAAALAIPVELIYYRKDEAVWKLTQPVCSRPKKVYYAVAPVLGISGCLAINNMLNISGLFRLYQEDLDRLSDFFYSGKLAVELVGTVVLAAVLEELIFRGILQQRIRALTGPGPAIAASAVLFGCYHGNTLQMLYAGLLGLLIAYTYEKYHSLTAAILVHGAANLVSVLGSETTLLQFMYGDDVKLMAGTGLWLGVIFVCIFVIHTFVNPVPVHTEEAGPREEPEHEDR